MSTEPISTEPISTEPMAAMTPRMGMATADHVTARQLSGTELHKLAESGGFAVDDETGNRMIESLNAIVNALEQRWQRLQVIGRDPQLSTTPAARFVASHMQQTASDERGLLTQLEAARAELPRYVEAIRLAKQNYAEKEQSTSDALATYRPEV